MNNDGWNTGANAAWPQANTTNQAWPTPVEQPKEPELSQAIIDRLKAENAANSTYNYPLNKDGLLMLWQRQKEILAIIKDDEMELRKASVKYLVVAPVEGVNNVELGNGYTAKAGIKFNYKLCDDNDLIEKTLDAIEATGNEGKFLAERLVTWKASLSTSEYKKIVEDAEKGFEVAKKILLLLQTIVSIEDAAPTLEIKEPKKKALK